MTGSCPREGGARTVHLCVPHLALHVYGVYRYYFKSWFSGFKTLGDSPVTKSSKSRTPGMDTSQCEKPGVPQSLCFLPAPPSPLNSMKSKSAAHTPAA